MKLSEAIILGSVGSKQGFGFLSVDPEYRETEGLCALGAALFATNNKGHMANITKVWPWTRRVIDHRIPGIPSLGQSICGTIWRINDTLRWTRPQIAAWVASIEPDELPEKTVDSRQYTGATHAIAPWLGSTVIPLIPLLEK